MGKLDQVLAIVVVGGEVVVIPVRIGRMEHHMRALHEGAHVQCIHHALLDNLADERVLRIDREADKWTMGADAALVAVEQAIDRLRHRTPVAIHGGREVETLDFHIAIHLEDPVAVLGDMGRRQAGPDDRQVFGHVSMLSGYRLSLPDQCGRACRSLRLRRELQRRRHGAEKGHPPLN